MNELVHWSSGSGKPSKEDTVTKEKRQLRLDKVLLVVWAIDC